MDTFSEEFRDWMDQRRLSAPQVAEALHVSEQTVRHWRSGGIPPRRQPVVKEWMRAFDQRADVQVADLRKQTLIIEPTRDEFRSWNQAALLDGKLMEDWIKDGLNRLAQEGLHARHNAQKTA